MSRIEAAQALLHTSASRWRRQRLAAWGGAAIGAATLGASIGLLTPAGPIVPGLIGAVMVALWGRHRLARVPITARTAAEHADRILPTLEESATLLLTDPAVPAPLLVRLQRERAAEALLAAPPLGGLPQPNIRLAGVFGLAALALAALVTVVPVGTMAKAPTPIVPAASTYESPPLTIGTITLDWTPPAYLGQPADTATRLDATVPEGSVVRWRVTATAASAVRLVDARGDTIAARASDDGWLVERVVDQSLLWRAEAIGADGTVAGGGDHRLIVVPDRPPVIAILAPAQRVTLDWDEPHVVVVRAVVSDDHALGALGLVATHGRGRGEGVRFRDTQLGVEVETATSPGSRVVSRRVDLDSLGVAPGDEVFLAFTAQDRREPVANTTRSETIFLALRDTVLMSYATLAGVALQVEPAYFRSQRQIILDTEELLREARLGRVRDVGPRAIEIGLDQHLLRLRYGPLVGEETEGLEAAGDDDHADHDEEQREVTMDDFIHRHDMEENATLLSDEVKATLKRALASMWEAEKLLRTGRPQPALPHEYAALAALEEIRLTERAYVQRIGFTPPAVDVERVRLSRTARDLGPLGTSRDVTDHRIEPTLRDALDVLDEPASAARDGRLEAAGRRLAAIALEDAAGSHLETLGALRGLLDGSCPDCSAAVRRGLIAALPVPPPPIAPRP